MFFYVQYNIIYMYFDTAPCGRSKNWLIDCMPAEFQFRALRFIAWSSRPNILANYYALGAFG